MSIKIMTLIYDHILPDVNFDGHNVKGSSSKSVLLALADHAQNDGTSVYPSITRLVNKTQLGRRTVNYAMGALKFLGLIGCVGTSKWRTTRYKIFVGNIEKLPSWKDKMKNTSDSALNSQDSAPDALDECAECIDINALDAPKSLSNHNNNHKGNQQFEKTPPLLLKDDDIDKENILNDKEIHDKTRSLKDMEYPGKNKKKKFSLEQDEILNRFEKCTELYFPRNEKTLELAKFLLVREAEGDNLEYFPKWAKENGLHKYPDFSKYVVWPDDIIADWGPAMEAGRLSLLYIRPSQALLRSWEENGRD